jgi:glycosyltransferase involved in cell wall biosynthesis
MNSCCICGTVRNCGSYLEKVFANIEKIGALFNDYKIILFYDDSTDNTLAVLKDYQKKNDKLIFYSNKKLLSHRTHRIAFGRNTCLNFIKTNYPDYEYFIMMDCDDRCSKTFCPNVLNMYLKRHDWDSLSFNHPDGYYDTWALSIGPYVASCHHFRDNSLGKKYVTRLIQKVPKNALIKCYSAFNGFAIYRTSKFLNCYYDGRFRLDYIPTKLLSLNIKASGNINLSQNIEDCEHRHFHFDAIRKNNARIRISPLCVFL